MKNFSELTTEEISSMTDEEFLAVDPYEKKSCAECGWLKASVTWWCKNPEAVEARGTAIPGIIKCAYWKPDEKYIKTKYKK